MLALARKYRPKSFSEVAVQSHVANTLRGAIASGRLAHGYLLCGPRGTGKTTLARVLAMALNCEQRDSAVSGEPCGKCISCQRIWGGSSSLDVIEIDAASNRGVDDARDLRERAMYAPSGENGYKVYIVDEAHMLTREAWNALLKILEEPPPRVIFVFATTEPQKIAQTAAPVLSRLQRFDLKRIGPAEIRTRLDHVLREEGVKAEPDAVSMIARAADGSMRDALSLADQALALGDRIVSTERVRESLGLVPDEELLSILDLVTANRAGEIFGAVASLADAGIDFGVFLSGVADMIRAQLAVELGSVPDDISDRMRDGLVERKGRVADVDLLRMLNVIGEIEPRFRRSGQQRLLVETILVRLALLDRAVAIEDLLRNLGGSSSGSPDLTPGRSDVARSTKGSSDVARSTQPRPADVRAPIEVAHEPAISQSLDLNALIDHWDAFVTDVRRSRTMLASVLERSLPVAVTAAGAVTLDAPDEAARHAIESARDDVLAALRARVPGVTRIAVRETPGASLAAPARRITEQTVREERIASLRRTDPVLAAALDELDLDLME